MTVWTAVRSAAAVAALLAVARLLRGVRRARRSPAPCPYAARNALRGPRPFFGPRRLVRALAPEPGEKLLEVGPGTGYYTLAVASELGPGGRLDIADVQQEMLDHTMSEVERERLRNVVPTLADAASLPFGDSTFDRAYLVTVIGEVPDQDAALRELRRVLTPRGRLVVGEVVADPHFVRFGRLAERAHRAGFRLEARFGPPFAYFAAFRPAGGPAGQ